MNKHIIPIIYICIDGSFRAVVTIDGHVIRVRNSVGGINNYSATNFFIARDSQGEVKYFVQDQVGDFFQFVSHNRRDTKICDRGIKSWISTLMFDHVWE